MKDKPSADVSRATLFRRLNQVGAQELVEQFGVLGAAFGDLFFGGGEFFAGLEKVVGDLQGREDRHTQRIDGHRRAGDLVHAPVNVFGEVLNVGVVVIAAQIVSLVIDDDLVWLARIVVHRRRRFSELKGALDRPYFLAVSSASRSSTAMASSIASTLSLIVSRSF